MTFSHFSLKQAFIAFVQHKHGHYFHLLVLSIIAVLLLSSFWSIEQALQDNRLIVEAMNINNQQRILIQQIHSDATQLVMCHSQREAQDWLARLQAASQQLSHNHQQLLTHSQNSTLLAQVLHPVFFSAPYQFNEKLTVYLNLIKHLEDSDPLLLTPSHSLYKEIGDYKIQLLSAQDALSEQYAGLSEQKMSDSLWLERIIFSVSFIALMCLWLLVFRPLERRLATEHAAQTQYRALFESSPSGIAVYQAINDGEDFIFLDFNKSGEKMENIERSDILGQRVTDVFPGVIEFGLLNIFRAVYQDAKPRQHPISFYQDNRLCGWRENYVYKLSNGEVVAIYEDITPRKVAEKALQESEARFRSIFDHASLGIALVDKEGRPVLSNQALQKFLGYSAEELLMMSFVDVTHPDDAYLDVKQYQALFNHEIYSYNMEKRYVHKNGHTLWAHLTVSIVLEEEGEHPTFSIGMVEDIRERKQAEEALHRSKEELEQRVIERTSDLQRSNQDLQHSLEELKAAQQQLVESEKMASLGGLVAGVAHEVNTPVGVGVTAASHLRGQVQTYYKKYHSNSLTRGDFEDFLNTADSSSEMILSNLKRAADLVRSFKQIAVDYTNEEQRPLRLKAYLQDILQSLHPRFKRTQHTVSIECEEDFVVLTYPGVLSQILTNLLVNSLEHGLRDIEQGIIHIEIVQAPSFWSLEYRDSGVGIPIEHQRKIFEPFFTTRRNEGGSGLGLHIVYNLITQTLKGQIHCTSEVHQGAQFNIEIPFITE